VTSEKKKREEGERGAKERLNECRRGERRESGFDEIEPEETV